LTKKKREGGEKGPHGKQGEKENDIPFFGGKEGKKRKADLDSEGKRKDPSNPFL